MTVTYGTDYSAGELSVSELDGFKDYDIRFLIRYIGWPDNPKCISHYPGAYQAHVDAGRMVLLVAEQATNDPAGGFGGGVAMAQRALSDARSVGYPDNLPIFFCSHGGYQLADRDWVRQIQQALIRKGDVPGVSDPNSPWADGIYTEPTRQAVLRFQESTGQPQTGNIGPGDWAALLS